MLLFIEFILASGALVVSGVAVWLFILPFIIDVSLVDRKIVVLLFRLIRVASFDLANVSECSLASLFDARNFGVNPFRTFGLVDRLRSTIVVVHRKGILNTIFISPKDPAAFVAAVVRCRPAVAGARKWV